MQNQSIEFLFARPIDNAFEQELAHAASAPFRFGEDIDDESVPAFRQSAHVGRMRERMAKLHAGACNYLARRIDWTGQPANIFAARKKFPQSIATSNAKCFE